MATAGKKSRALAPAALLVVAVLLLAPPLRAEVSCSTVYDTLMPCLQYVMSGGSVPPACCSGIKAMVSSAHTAADRRAACGCLKEIAAEAPRPSLSRAAGLPGKCHVQVPFKIDPNVNCNAVH